MPYRLFVSVLLTCLLAGASGCGLGTGDEIILQEAPPDAGVPDPVANPLDADLAVALAAAGVVPVPLPPPEDPALVDLGRMLFFDKEISGNRNISCATCHHPAAATGDGLPIPIGEGGVGLAGNRDTDGGRGALIPRNAPHVFNGGVAGVDSMFWDSRIVRDPVSGILTTPEPGLNGAAPALPAHALPLSSALAAQAMFPVTSREEMRGQVGSNPDVADAPDNESVWRALMLRLVGTDAGGGGIAGYRALFQAAYPSVASFDAFTFGHAARAMAAYERQVFTALDTRLDRYLAGDTTALSDTEKRGALLFFGRAGCAECHDGPLLSDFEHHALCVPQLGPGKTPDGDDRGRSNITGDAADDYRFRTPALRNVALTGPWMHDGAFTTLEGAVRHHLDAASNALAYDPSQLPPLFAAEVDTDPGRQAARLAAIDPLVAAPIDLTEAEIDDLMAFLHALTDPASLNLLFDIPGSVPSGLPVRD